SMVHCVSRRSRPHCRSNLFPYTTLFRSDQRVEDERREDRAARRAEVHHVERRELRERGDEERGHDREVLRHVVGDAERRQRATRDRKSTRLNSSHVKISYAVFCLKKKNK